MAEAVDYFTNHRNKLRFPWRLYHGPIVAALRSVLDSTTGADVLNLGSGPFFELDELDVRNKRLTLCDVDARAIEAARRMHGSRIERADVAVSGEPLPYADAAFDLVVSMDVIEHVADPAPWLREAFRVLRPSGTLFLTTPNYSSWSLRLIESSLLELVARRQGFSRKLLHPSKMTPQRLMQLLSSTGNPSTEITKIAFGWVLTSRTQKGGP